MRSWRRRFSIETTYPSGEKEDKDGNNDDDDEEDSEEEGSATDLEAMVTELGVVPVEKMVVLR